MFTYALLWLVVVKENHVGVLLIGALLIIPAAAARPLSPTPERMALTAIAIGIASTLGGLAAAWHLDTPAGPSIVSVAALAFLVTQLWAGRA